MLQDLLTLRERQNLSVYAHQRVHSVLKQNSIFNVLNPEYVDRREMKMNEKFELKDKKDMKLESRLKLLRFLEKLHFGLKMSLKGKILGLEMEIQ